MDLVNQNRKVQRIARVGIDGLRRVAQYAHLHATPGSPMERELIMTAIAAGRLHHVSRHRNRRAVRPEVVRSRCVAGTQSKLCQVPRAVGSNRVGRVDVKSAGRLRCKRIFVDAVADLSKRPARVRRGLDRGHTRNRALL